MRALVLTESLARVAKMEFLLDALDRAGVPRAKLDIAVVVPEDKRDCKRGDFRRYADHLAQTLAENTTPTVVLVVGNAVLEAVTGKKGIKQKRGRPWEQGGNIYVPILPPGVTLYDERTIPMIEADAQLFADCVRHGKIPREEALDWTIVDTREKFDAMLADLRGTVAFDVETTGLNPWVGHLDVETTKWVWDGRVVSVGFGTRDHQWCLPLNHPEQNTPEVLGLTFEQIFARLDRRMRECYLVGHNAKFDNLWLRVHYGVDWRPDFDTMLAHWMLDENQRHGLKLLAQLYFGAPNYDADLDHKQGAGPLYPHCQYLAHDVFYTRQLRFKLGKMLDEDEGVRRSFETITMPVAKLFCDVEWQGVLIDHDRLDKAEEHLLAKLKEAHLELTAALVASGIPKEEAQAVNWKSPKQIASVLFDRIGIKPIAVKKKKGGVNARSTAETVLKQITHPVGVALMKYRGANQLLQMFIEGWKPFLVLHADGWRLHPSFKLHGTVTGRASCEHPNLQQVPRDELIRSLIIAALGFELFDMDLSQIEMRISAELSGDQVLLGIFERDEDVHWMTATKEIARGGGMADEVMKTAKVFIKKYPKTPWLKPILAKYTDSDRLDYGAAMRIVYLMGPELAAELMPVWKELRKKAKAINFGYLFGMWWKKMIDYARDNYGVHLTEKQAQESRKSFFETYPALAPWHERQKRYAMRHGYVRSLTGAKRRLPDAQSHEDSPKRGEALRQAINSPVQRFACELNYMVLLQLVEEFGLDVVRPIGTVHDAILAEVRSSHVVEVYERVDQIMRKPKLLEELGIKIRVPIKGEAKIGPWSKGVSLNKWKAKVAA